MAEQIPGPSPGAAEAAPGRMQALRLRGEAVRQGVGERAEELRGRSRTVRLLYDTYERDRLQAGALLAGGIAYRLFLWLLPASLLLVSVLGIVVEISGRSPTRVAGSAGFGAALAATIATAVTKTSRGSVYLLVLGTLLMIWAGIGVVKGMRLAAAVLWRQTPAPMTHSVKAALAFSGAMVGLLALPSVLHALHRAPAPVDALAELAMLALLFGVALLGQQLLPRDPAAMWSAFVPGAVAFAVGITIIRIVTQVYLVERLGRTEDLYGALGLAAVFMAWLYLVARIAIATIGLSASRWQARRRDAREDA